MRNRSEKRRWNEEDIQGLAEEVYVYGYPALLLDTMRRMHTAFPFPTAEGAPINHFWHSRFLPHLHLKRPLRPHADSLSSTAWVDVSREPVIVSIPATDRYYLLSIFSAWGDIFEAISTRTGGMGGLRAALVGPRWKGRLPDGVSSLVTSSNIVWINGRVQMTGAEDLQLAHHVQDQFALTPLSGWGKSEPPHTSPFPPDIDKGATALDYVGKLSAPGFYTRLSRLMRKIPPPVSDALVLRRFAQIGFFPSDDFAFERLPALTAQAMQSATTGARLTIARAAESPALHVNNWSMRIHPRRSDRNYLSRAAAAMSGFSYSLAEEVTAFHAAKDRAGEMLRGTNEYVIQFDQEHLPPVNGFWSVTLYDSKHLLSANSIHRHVLGDRDRLRLNPDNSISIYIQHNWPGTMKDCNWLPAPRETFELVLQLYWPKTEVLGGMWRPPALTRIH
ncbi:MAG TPA: DUF1254 domain-containing protein [Terriglobia bacterium]|jgi:hypothetical protein